MKAIILAAGKGSRISAAISQRQKCLLPIMEPELPLIVYTIQRLRKYAVKEIAVVTGYRHKEVEQAVQPYGVQCCFNPFYDRVNSLASLWFLSPVLDGKEDIVILNADTFLEDDLYRHLFAQKVLQEFPLLLVDSSRKDRADLKVRYADGFLTDYGKELAVPPMAESLDVALVPALLVTRLREQAQDLLEQGQHDLWWEHALVEYKEKMPIKIIDVAGYFWNEIDFIEDYSRIQDFTMRK